MRRLESCLVAPCPAQGLNPSKLSNQADGKAEAPAPVEQEVWECTSADILTLEKGFALDTCWVFRTSLPPANLKSSLGRLLAEYRPFAGRYSLVKRAVILNDAGVSFEVFEDDEYDFERVEAEHHSEAFANRFIDYSSTVPGYIFANQPLMRVRLTYLRDGACVLSVFASHGVCDGDTFYSMMDRWSKLARESSEPASVIWDQSQVPYERRRRSFSQVLSGIKDHGWGYLPIPWAGVRLGMVLTEGIWFHHKVRTEPFALSAEGLARLKLAAELDCKTSGKRLSSQGITTNEALSAFLCQLLGKVFSLRDSEPCGHSTMYNWRGRLPGMSVKFAGNASSAILTSRFFAGSCLGDIAADMNRNLEVFKSDGEEIQSHVELFLDSHDHGLASHMADPRTLPYLSPAPTTTVTNNFARYPIYAVDFGVERPALVVPHRCGDQVVIWPARDGQGGVELYFQGTTALRIANLSIEDRSWFEQELYKFELLFTREKVQAWFDSRLEACTNNKKTDEQPELDTVLSPIAVTRKPSDRTDAFRGVASVLVDQFVYPLGVMLGICS